MQTPTILPQSPKTIEENKSCHNFSTEVVSKISDFTFKDLVGIWGLFFLYNTKKEKIIGIFSEFKIYGFRINFKYQFKPGFYFFNILDFTLSFKTYGNIRIEIPRDYKENFKVTLTVFLANLRYSEKEKLLTFTIDFSYLLELIFENKNEQNIFLQFIIVYAILNLSVSYNIKEVTLTDSTINKKGFNNFSISLGIKQLGEFFARFLINYIIWQRDEDSKKNKGKLSTDFFIKGSLGEMF